MLTYTPETTLMSLDIENQNRNKSLIAVGENPKLQSCIKLIEKATELLVKIFYRDHRNKNEETLKIIGFRLTDSLTASINIILTGWWYVSFMLFRNIFETFCLLYYFAEDRARIDEWRNSTRKERLKKFSSYVTRNSYKNRLKRISGDNKRIKSIDNRYFFYCEYGPHPTSKGIMSTSTNEEILTGWCFYDEEKIFNHLMELTVLSGFALHSFVRAYGEENISSEIKNEVDARLEEGLKWSSKNPGESYSDLIFD